MKMHRREFVALIIVGVIAVGLLADTGRSIYTTRRTSQAQVLLAQSNQANALLQKVGDSLIAHHEQSQGGWRFKSEIQSPHYQTDRDVGAASVGMGFLAIADAYPKDGRWIDAAKQTANWLMTVSSQDQHGGRYWHDYIDDNETASAVYTSFDDGAIGIGDFFWQLYEQTHEQTYKKVALETVQWTISQAEPYSQDGLKGYRWKWDVSDTASGYYMGMGEGAAGITYSLANYYERLKNSDPAMAAQCKKYAEGSIRYIEIVQKEQAKNTGSGLSIPETGVVGQDGDTALDSGYLSGAAGDAFMYLKLYQVFGDKAYLAKSEELLGWLSDTKNGPLVRVNDNSVTWRLELDPQGDNNDNYATGIEEGAAGIGWSFLQAYGQTGDKQFLTTAEQAGNWLLAVAVKGHDGGLSWHEDEHPANPLVHANLNNGAAGIGTFLQDMYRTTGNKKYQAGAQGAMKWLLATAKYHGSNIYWDDNGGSDPYSDDPSWHWGLAGLAEFAQRLKGGQLDMPGEQPSLDSKLLYNKK